MFCCVAFYTSTCTIAIMQFQTTSISPLLIYVEINTIYLYMHSVINSMEDMFINVENGCISTLYILEYALLKANIQ